MTTKLRSCNDVKVTKVTYEWEIKNFSRQLGAVGERLQSPLFYTSASKRNEWQLILHLKSREDSDFISLYLVLNNCGEEGVRCKYRFFVSPSKSFIGNAVTKIWTVGQSWGYSRFLERSEILKNEESYLMEDTLLVGCDLEIYEDISYNPSDNVVEADLQATIESHQFVNDLDSLIDDEDFTESDITIVCSSEKFEANKLILGGRSSVFSAMFENEEMIKGQNNEIEIKEMTPEVVKEMLHYIYTDKIRNEALALELLIASEKYQLKGLKAKCELIFIQSLHYTNAAEVLIQADLYEAEQLKQRALDFICEHETEVWKTEGFNKLMESDASLLAEIYKTRISKHMNNLNISNQ